jgi:hypothetical protein
VTVFILSDKWIEEVAKSQGIQRERTTRIIIDAKAGRPVYMYITQLGDSGILELKPPEVLEAEVESS